MILRKKKKIINPKLIYNYLNTRSLRFIE